VLGAHDQLAAELGESPPDLVARAAANIAARVGVLASAAGNPEGGHRLIERAAAIATPGSDVKKELDAALASPVEDAAAGVAKLVSGSSEPALREAARELVAAPKPISGAPPLFRVNGFGVGLYGSRDERPDGTYVATYFISALWIPIFPLTAYRVKRGEGSTYYFYAKESLGPVAKVWRSVVVLGTVLAIAGAFLADKLG
jgi:hypothetical protein